VGGLLATLEVLLAQPAHATGTSFLPRSIFLLYADGITPLSSGVTCDGASVPPAYTCSFGGDGGIESCKAQIQRFLDYWYRDLNVVFVRITPP